MHKVGGTAGEGGSHGVADYLRTAGVEQQGNDNAGKKDTQSGAACDAGGSFSRAFHHPQADDHHQCKQQGQIVQHGVGDEVGDQAAGKHGNGTRRAEVGGNGNGQRRSHVAHISSGEEQTGEKSAAALIEHAGNAGTAEKLGTAGIVHGGNVLSLRRHGNAALKMICVSIITICGKNICQNLLHHFRTMCLNLRRQGGQSGEGAFPVSLAKKSERVPVFGEHALISRQHRTKIVRYCPTSSDIPPAHAAIPECTVLRHGWSVSWGWRSSRSPCVPPYPAAQKQCRRRSGRH